MAKNRIRAHIYRKKEDKFMLKTKAIFSRKENDFEPKDCVIEKVITLGGSEYDRFASNMIEEYDFIAENKELMRQDAQGVFHCLLVVGEDRADGILVESEGASYARYSSFMPNAADFLQARDMSLTRKSEILDNILEAIGSRYEGEELYERLRDDFQMTDAEIEAAGFGLEDNAPDMTMKL